jgi:hypothetical protein
MKPAQCNGKKQKIKNQPPAPDERGFVLVIALIVLVLATVIGIFAIQNTTIDTKISGNERIATLLFNTADAGGSAGVGWFKANTTEGGIKLSTSNPISAPVGSYFGTDLNLGTNMRYNFKIDPLAKSTPPPPGWDPAFYRRYYYLIHATGRVTGSSGTKEIRLEVTRVFRK